MSTGVMLATPALAQQSGHQGMNHQGMNHSMPSTAANPYGPAEMQMHEKMMAATGADASETWVRKMIEHHRGGVSHHPLRPNCRRPGRGVESGRGGPIPRGTSRSRPACLARMTVDANIISVGTSIASTVAPL